MGPSQVSLKVNVLFHSSSLPVNRMGGARAEACGEGGWLSTRSPAPSLSVL